MYIFLREFFDYKNASKSLLGAILMGFFLVYENRGNPASMYAVALCGQLLYSFFLGNFWFSLYQTFKFKFPLWCFFRGLLSAFVIATVAGLINWGVQIGLMNPEAIPTAWWAFRLSLFAFLFNEFWCWYRHGRKP